MSDIESRVAGLISEKLKVPTSSVKRDASFTDDFKASSLDLVDLIMSFEEEFDLEIADEDAAKIVTVGDAIDYLEQHAE